MGAAPVARTPAACLLLQFCGAPYPSPFLSPGVSPRGFRLNPTSVCQHPCTSRTLRQPPEHQKSHCLSQRLQSFVLSCSANFPVHTESGGGLPRGPPVCARVPSTCLPAGTPAPQAPATPPHETSRVLPAPWPLVKALQAVRAPLLLDLPVSSPG